VSGRDFFLMNAETVASCYPFQFTIHDHNHISIKKELGLGRRFTGSKTS
jgi:hypothetical protein